MSMLATKFGRGTKVLNLNRPLDNDQIMSVAPSVFAENAHESRSARYTYIPTINIVEAMRKEGFVPFMVAQSGSRIEGKQEYTKHMIRFRHCNTIGKTGANEAILINSHDGSSSAQLLAGYLEFACHNGLVKGDITNDIRVHHKGNIVNDVIEAAYEIVDRFEIMDNERELFQSIQLSPVEREIFAESALLAKYDDIETTEEAPVKPYQLLLPARYSDQGKNDLWSTFNITQEILIRGGQRATTKTGKKTRTKEVKSIDNNIKINKALWNLTSKMAELKK